MKFLYIAICLSMVCCATAAHGQLPVSETENSAGIQTTKPSGYDQDAKVLMDAVRQVSEFGESDPGYEAAIYDLAELYRQ